MQKKTRDDVHSSDTIIVAAEDTVTAKGGCAARTDEACSLLELLGRGESVVPVGLLHQVALADHLADDGLGLVGGLELLLGAVDLALQLGDALLLRLLVGPHVGLPGSVLVDLGPGPAPLGTDLEEGGRGALLRGDGVGGLDDGQDLGVDRDVHVALLGHAVVAGADAALDPVGEGAANDRVADVEDPLRRKGEVENNRKMVWRLIEVTYLPRESGNVLVHGEVRPRLGVVLHELVDLRAGERLVLGGVDVLDVLALDGLLLHGHDLLHEVDVDGLERRQVEAGVHGEQAGQGEG